ncbi:MAG: ChaN family lipoprotein [Desulfobacteraceae bacterium]|nr:ChaN family lipoprotein [Desulfobacteraceae bacterium]
MRPILKTILLLAMGSIIQACGVKQVEPFRNDPLIGKLINTSTGEIMEMDALVDRLLSADVIYLAEKHDNPEHHRLQNEIIKALTAKGKRPQLGFEFFSTGDTPILLDFLDSHRAKHPDAVEKQVETMLRKQLGWDDKSDDLWPYYFELLSLARKENLLAAGLDLSDAQKRRITRKGSDNLTEIEKRSIFSTRLDDKTYRDYMCDIFADVHCGMKNPRMQSRLFDTWIARNDTMAHSIVQLHDAEPDRPVVVIIGGGHTEHNLGVVDRVRHIIPGISQFNVGFVEIARTPSGVEDYLAPLELEGYAPSPPFDYVWFTQRVSYQDPCEKYRKRLEKSRLHRKE